MNTTNEILTQGFRSISIGHYLVSNQKISLVLSQNLIVVNSVSRVSQVVKTWNVVPLGCGPGMGSNPPAS